jgi:hypothetical protein
VLETVLMHLKNWFVVKVHSGIYEIENNALELPFLQNGQYYRICGSVFNDGLHKYGDTTDVLTDETFTGTVWALAIPKAIIELSEKIDEWQTKNANAVESPFSSESFGGYSYTKATDSETGGFATWETVFKKQLNQYRKLHEYAPVKKRGS